MIKYIDGKCNVTKKFSTNNAVKQIKCMILIPIGQLVKKLVLHPQA